jgi:hypothetical protein
VERVQAPLFAAANHRLLPFSNEHSAPVMYPYWINALFEYFYTMLRTKSGDPVCLHSAECERK